MSPECESGLMYHEPDKLICLINNKRKKKRIKINKSVAEQWVVSLNIDSPSSDRLELINTLSHTAGIIDGFWE